MESQDLGACLGGKPELHVAAHTVDHGMRPSARRHRIALIAGTRPEAIKLAPVAAALSRRSAFELVLLAAGQHDGEVRHVFDDWRLAYTALAPIGVGGGWRRTCKLQASRLRGLLGAAQIDMVVVQGDTSSALAGTLAAKSIGSPLAHVEAGLRSPDRRDPYPEDLIRRLITRHAALHFAPTLGAGGRLIKEGVPESSIFVVGSTAVDALRRSCSVAHYATEAPDLVVTLHRRENWTTNLDKICAALLAVTNAHPGLRILWPLHPNPTLADRVRRNLNAHPDFKLVAPMRHQDFLAAVKAAGRVLTDSGGIQEEVPYLGVRALVARLCTERPESIVSGHVSLIAPDSPQLHAALLTLLESRRPESSPFDSAAPWGDGQAGTRIASLIEQYLAEYRHAPC